MAFEESRFFDSVEQDKEYYADDFAEYFRMFLTSGVWEMGENLNVRPGNGLSVTIGYGAGMIQGYGYWLKDNGEGLLQKNFQPAASQPRIDRVVLQLNTSLAARKVSIEIKTGAAAAEPVAPELTRSGNIYELSLAQVRIEAGALSLSGDKIVDERADEELCGIVEPRAVTEYLNQGVKTTDSPVFEKVTAKTVVGAVYQ